MSYQLFNPKAGKFVNASPAQADTLKKAGWLAPGDKKIEVILKKIEAAEEKAKEEAEAEAKLKAEAK